MLDVYASAFASYLRTGTVGALRDFCDTGADLARLRVYRNGFLKTCVDALRASYPSVERIVGEERFPALARPWVEAHPPGTASLVEYGEGFPQHLRDTRDRHGLDWLASFAALDRAWTAVYFAEDDDTEGATGAAPAGRDSGALPGPARTPASAGDVPFDAETLMNLGGRLTPRARLVSLEFRVLDAWSRLRRGEPVRRAEVRRAPQRVLVWRSGEEMRYRDLAPPEHALIAGVAAGRPCGEAAGAALALDAEFDLVATFASLLHHRMLFLEHRRPAGQVVRRTGGRVDRLTPAFGRRSTRMKGCGGAECPGEVSEP